MAKRVQRLDLWDKDWFIGLEDHYKLFYQYIEDNCSEAGIWAPQKALFERLLATRRQIDYYKFIEQVNEGCGDVKRIVILENGSWLITDYFAERQGNEIKISNGFHRRVIKDLIFHKALAIVHGIINIDEAVTDYEEWNKERKKRQQQKLKAMAASSYIEEDTYHHEPNFPLPGQRMIPEPAPDPEPPVPQTPPSVPDYTIKKIQLVGAPPDQILPEIEFLQTGNKKDIHIEKFLRAPQVGLWAYHQGILDATRLKKIIEAFIKKVQSLSENENKTAEEMQTYLYHWYNRVKNNSQFMTDLTVEKRTTPIKLPRKVNLDPPDKPS